MKTFNCSIVLNKPTFKTILILIVSAFLMYACARPAQPWQPKHPKKRHYNFDKYK